MARKLTAEYVQENFEFIGVLDTADTGSLPHTLGSVSANATSTILKASTEKDTVAIISAIAVVRANSGDTYRVRLNGVDLYPGNEQLDFDIGTIASPRSPGLSRNFFPVLRGQLIIDYKNSQNSTAAPEVFLELAVFRLPEGFNVNELW